MIAKKKTVQSATSSIRIYADPESVKKFDRSACMARLLRDQMIRKGPNLWASISQWPSRSATPPDPPFRNWYGTDVELHSPSGFSRRLYLKTTSHWMLIDGKSLSAEYAEHLIEKSIAKMASEWSWFLHESAHEAGRLLPGKAGKTEGRHCDRWVSRLFSRQAQRSIVPGGSISDGFYTEWMEVHAESSLLLWEIFGDLSA